MPDDKPLKSAYEIAMERLRERDREQGIEESAPLSEEQKQEISRLRRDAESRLAEIEILHRKALAEVGPEPEKRAELEERYRIDRRRVESGLESAIARVRKGNG
jgi:hypothetical protein